jgi:hypothetical protein
MAWMSDRWDFEVADVKPLIEQAGSAKQHLGGKPGLYFVSCRVAVYLVSSQARTDGEKGCRRAALPSRTAAATNQTVTRTAAADDPFTAFIPLSMCQAVLDSETDRISLLALSNGTLNLRGWAGDKVVPFQFTLFRSPLVISKIDADTLTKWVGMTRKKLASINGERKAFEGIFVRYGKKPAWNSPTPLRTLLLKDIREVASGELITDHLWFNLTKGFEAIEPLSGGDRIQFEARVKPYEKGYVNWRQFIDERIIDYKLSHPTKIRKIVKGK